MISLADVVGIEGCVEREFLVAVDVNDRPLPKRALEPHAHGAVHVLAIPAQRIVLLVIIVIAAHQHPNADLVVLLVHDHLTHPAIIAAEGDAKLELADIPFPKPERTT